MSSVLQRLPQGARLAIVRLRSLGDCVLATPAIHLLKLSRPDLNVAMVVEDCFAGVFEGNPDVGALLPPQAGLLRRWRPELCLNLHGGTHSLWLACASGARIRAGFAHFSGSFLYHVRIPTAQEILGVTRTVHTAEHMASAMFHLGAERREIPRARLFADPHRAERRYAVVHPFATGPGKTWPAGGFLAVAERLRLVFDMEPIFIGAAADDFRPFEGYGRLQGAPLADVKSFIAGASLFVGNDSGPAHMAAAFGLPVLAVFGSMDPAIWGPWRTPAQVVGGDGRPIESIPAEEVLGALERLRRAA